MINALLSSLMLSMSVTAAESESGLLMLAYKSIHSSEECGYFMGPGVFSSLPLPVRVPGGVRYRQMFYRSSSPDSQWHRPTHVMAPGWLVEYVLDGTQVDCRLEIDMPRSEFGKPVGRIHTSAVAKMNNEERDKEVALMLDKLQALSPAFAKGRADPKTAAAAKDFRARFMKLAEPGLIPYYRALSPGFWNWLDGFEKNARRR